MIKEVIMLVTVININIPPKVDMDMTTYEKFESIQSCMYELEHNEGYGEMSTIRFGDMHVTIERFCEPTREIIKHE